MRGRIQSILVLGLGKVGFLVAELLHLTGFKVTGADLSPIKHKPYNTIQIDVTSPTDIEQKLDGYDAVISCLPYHFNLGIASIAHQKGIHYFDLTEDVPTTKTIIEMSKDSSIVMAPQCGLAPGFIAIVGASLAAGFERIRSIKLRVGALPQHPTGLLGYAFNWSPEGVVNEYLNDCEVIEEGKHKWVSPMEWHETLVINGIQLEAFTTSGGLGTMCETFLDKVDNLDYKSIRYPGHVQQMNFFFHELLMREQRELAGKILTNAKPAVNDDVVFVHASAEGWKNDQLFRDEFVKAYYPITLGTIDCRAISWTTAASICSIVEMVNNGSLPEKGFIKQEEIPLEDFLKTKNGRLYTGTQHGGIMV
ncbi:saccharopine dehydrogenase family protein [Desulfosediminicola flagellatus]|uniref:saccharopine dehydrogenase family protein n=1 Tax=Desulfosediminicola flagellatus TaxID=2569541 RepID=UPI0010AB6113|nr:saccharopine dehydrogenase C-terminal domain-containing protein [Desulfosediminicola flagellatus]